MNLDRINWGFYCPWGRSILKYAQENLQEIDERVWKLGDRAQLKLLVQQIDDPKTGESSWKPRWEVIYSPRTVEQVMAHTSDGIIPEPVIAEDVGYMHAGNEMPGLFGSWHEPEVD